MSRKVSSARKCSQSDDSVSLDTKSVSDNQPLPGGESLIINRESPESILSSVIEPIECGKIAKCCLRRERRGPLFKCTYQLYCGHDSPVLIARDKSTLCATIYHVIEPETGERIGIISSDFKSLKYEVVSTYGNFVVEYDSNFMGANGARSFKIRGIADRVFLSKPPVIINGNYFQDFHGMNLMESIKNLIVVEEGDFSKEILLFGKNTDNVYEMRVTTPFSVFHAFVIAMTALHTGLWHR